MRILTTSLLLSFATALAVTGCWPAVEAEEADSTAQADTGTPTAAREGQTITGTVRHVALEGGFYGIVAEGGRRYDPVNLPDDFKQDGLSVICRARVLRDRASFHMWGQLIEIIEIQRR